MGKEDRYLRKVMDDRSILERIAMYLPGYRGYREKNLRRETDQLIRRNLDGVLRTGVKDIEWSYREAVNSFPLANAERIGAVLMRADATAQKVMHAKYGYSGIWEAAKVQENELSSLIRFDASLIELAQAFRLDGAVLKDVTKKNDLPASMAAIDSVESKIEEFERVFAMRDEAMLGLRPGGI